MNRDELRSAAFKSTPRKRDEIEINGVKFEIVQPLVKDREEIADKADGNQTKLLIYAVIAMTVVPGTDEKVFEDSDYETFRNQAVGGVLDNIAEKVLAFLNVEKDTKKP